MKKREEGITLLALIITIILLVILAAIVIGEAYNLGIIKVTEQGAKDYAHAIVNENKIMNSTAHYVESTIAKLKELQKGKETTPLTKEDFEEKANEEAKKGETKNIGYDLYGNIIEDFDNLWYFEKRGSDESWQLNTDTRFSEGQAGYNEAEIENGTIKGQIPAYIVKIVEGEIVDKGPVTSYKGLFQNLTELKTIPDNVIVPSFVIKFNEVFSGSGITEIPNAFKQFNDSVEEIEGMFANTKITSIPDDFKLGNSIKYINYMFQGTNITSIPESFVIPNSVTTMEGMFMNCKEFVTLPSGFKIPEKVTNMTDTFRNCPNLTTLPSDFTIPESVENLDSTFKDCTRLTGSLLIAGNPAPRNSFKKVAELADDDFVVYYTDKCTPENVAQMTNEIGTGKVRFEKKVD